MDDALETRTRELAEGLWNAEPSSWRRPLSAVGRRQLGRLDERPALRSAIFRFVDVAPACRGARERGAHLRAFLREVEGERVPLTLRPLRARRAPGGLLALYGLGSGPATAMLARQFIAGRDVSHATRNLRRMWARAQAFALDLLGEATVTEAEAQAYLRDADETLQRILASPALTGRAVPATIRLVKGAYWDHELVIASQRGWAPPVWEEKRASDATFERLSRRLIDARELVRPAIA